MARDERGAVKYPPGKVLVLLTDRLHGKPGDVHAV